MSVDGRVRILVVLHLFYADLWPRVRGYLENLGAFDWDLTVTYPAGHLPPSALADVRAFRPDVRLLPCPNAGFDVGPFVAALNGTDLDAYDIVFKLQTKGCGKEVYAYGQLFRGDDWFRDLFDGVLSKQNVGSVVTALTSGGYVMAAAENLIVADSYDRQWLVHQQCRTLGLACREDYRFVAGTCLAVRSSALKPLQALNLAPNAFANSRRGEFSLGHALERIMCFPAGGKFFRTPVARRDRATDIRRLRERNRRFDMLEDKRFRLNPNFLVKSLEAANVDAYDVVERRLGDLSFHGKPQCPFADGGEGRCAWCRDSGDPLKLPVVDWDDDFVLEGCCRCRDLLERFGPDHRLRVVRTKSGPHLCGCVASVDVEDAARQVSAALGVGELTPIRQHLWKPDSVLFTLFFEGRAKDGTRCFVKYMPFARDLVETEWRTGQAFQALLPANGARPLGCCTIPGGGAAVAHDYLPGRTLGELLSAKSVEAGLAAQLADEMIRIAEALSRLGFCHRDVRPDNLLLADDGRLKLIDFQFATKIDCRAETPFSKRHWKCTLAGLGDEYRFRRGLWNDRLAFARCLRELPDFDGKVACLVRLLEEAPKATCQVRLPFRMRWVFFLRWLPLALRNFNHRLRGKREKEPELEEFYASVCFGRILSTLIRMSGRFRASRQLAR